MSIRVDIEKTLGSFRLRAKFQAENETLALLGASGCGKSMTLRCIAGVERPDRGCIEIDGETVFDSRRRIDRSPQARRTGLMFQNYALFPNMTVLQNIRAGASREKDRKRREAAVETVVDSFGLTPLVRHYPHQLSGGQQQRVALARILVSDPRILLLDEPFSALDSHLRFQIEQEVREVIRHFRRTVLLVSHDRDEVFRMADSIAVMDRGNILTVGKKEAVFAAPQTRSGALLTGCRNISTVRVEAGAVRALDWNLPLRLPEHRAGLTAVGIRMHDVRLGPGENSVHCRVEEVVEAPFSCTVFLRVPGAALPIGCELSKEQWSGYAAEELEISLPPEKLLLLYDEERN